MARRCPARPSLSIMMKVSRITVRRAIEELAARGLVVRAQGRDTRVRQNIGRTHYRECRRPLGK